MDKELLKLNGNIKDKYIPYSEIFEMKIFIVKKPKANESLLSNVYTNNQFNSMVNKMKEIENQIVFLEEPTWYLGKGYGKVSVTITFDEGSYIKLKQNKIIIDQQALSDMLKEILDLYEKEYKENIIIIMKAKGTTNNLKLDLTNELDLDITPILDINN
jgi:dihydroxyacetone kinase-like predicted kinase